MAVIHINYTNKMSKRRILYFSMCSLKKFTNVSKLHVESNLLLLYAEDVVGRYLRKFGKLTNQHHTTNNSILYNHHHNFRR